MNYVVKNLRMHVDGLKSHISDIDLLCESIIEGDPQLFDRDEIGNALIGIRTLMSIRKDIFDDLVLSLENIALTDSQLLDRIIPIAEDEEEFYKSYEERGTDDGG